MGVKLASLCHIKILSYASACETLASAWPANAG